MIINTCVYMYIYIHMYVYRLFLCANSESFGLFSFFFFNNNPISRLQRFSNKKRIAGTP